MVSQFLSLRICNSILTQTEALGVVLLEIGLWQTVTTIKGIDLEATIKNSKEGEAPKAIYDKLLRQSKGRLGHKCGDRFQHIVTACLEGKSGDLEAGRSEYDGFQVELQKKFYEVVVEPLKTLAEALSAANSWASGQLLNQKNYGMLGRCESDYVIRVRRLPARIVGLPRLCP
jgi:hypothetical protein